MPRKIAILVAALLVPGGFIALFGAAILKALQNTERGRKVMDLARSRAPSWPALLGGAPVRRAA